VSSAAIIDDNVLDELVNVLTLSGIGELRRCVSAFENEFALAVGTRHAVGANSGTSALYFALRALGIGPGDEVATVANSWITTVTAVHETGARCQFVDVSPETGVMDPVSLEARINERTRAVVPVHMYGNPADMEAICRIARLRNIAVIEDACQGVGATFGGKPVGSWGSAGCFSFHANKLVGAPADGGMVVTDSVELANRVRHLSEPDWNAQFSTPQVRVPSRLPPLAVPVLRAKLRRVEREVADRRAQFERYRDGLATRTAARLLHAPANGQASFRTCVLVSSEAARIRTAAKRLNWSLEPMYKESSVVLQHLTRENRLADLPYTDFLIKHQLVLPNGPNVTNQDIDSIIAEIIQATASKSSVNRIGGGSPETISHPESSDCARATVTSHTI